MRFWKIVLGLFLCLVLIAFVAQPVTVEAAETVTVYLDPASGSDSADGLTDQDCRGRKDRIAEYSGVHGRKTAA